MFLKKMLKFRLKIKKAKNSGFTLFEFLIVIALLGLIIAIETGFINNFWKKKDETRYHSELVKFASLCQMLAEKAPECILPEGSKNLSEIECLKHDVSFQIWVPKYICKNFIEDESKCDEAYLYISFVKEDDDFNTKLNAAKKAYRRSNYINLFITDSLDNLEPKDKCLNNNCEQVYFGCRIY